MQYGRNADAPFLQTNGFVRGYSFCTFYTANPFVSGLFRPRLFVKETTKTTEDNQCAKPLVLRHIDNFINHGRTRTGFANARLDSEWRKRKRGASVSVCGSSHKEHKEHKGWDATGGIVGRRVSNVVAACPVSRVSCPVVPERARCPFYHGAVATGRAPPHAARGDTRPPASAPLRETFNRGFQGLFLFLTIGQIGDVPPCVTVHQSSLFVTLNAETAKDSNPFVFSPFREGRASSRPSGGCRVSNDVCGGIFTRRTDAPGRVPPVGGLRPSFCDLLNPE